ncbi:serine hydrolase [Butyrivibrio fibrisolvens]|uniref:serine hydrolase n=1 Tax=Butyrivibrio fibrisolvens TaxID=831 RepID=UPI000945C562|nr:serine hydrolase [Butyrivibrio fibrisolvens]
MTHNSAVAVGIMDGDENIYLEYCDITGKSVDEHTLFELGSTTKAFTGLGILFTLYIALLLDYRKKKLCLYGGIVVLIVLILIPVISCISYRFMFVWMPYSFSVMIISILAFAIWLIARGREE